jgi:hypothetical protein
VLPFFKNLIFGAPGSPREAAYRSTGRSSTLKMPLFFWRWIERRYATNV